MGRDVRLAMRAGVITAPLGLTAYGNSGSQLTLCWRKADSNPWSALTKGSTVCRALPKEMERPAGTVPSK